MEPQPNIEPKKPSSLPLIILVILLIFSLAASGFVYYQNTLLQRQITTLTTASTPQSPSPTLQPSEALAQEATTTWRTYTDPHNTFSFKYPPTLTITQNLEKNLQTGYRLFEMKQDKQLQADIFVSSDTSAPTTELQPISSINGYSTYQALHPNGYPDDPTPFIVVEMRNTTSRAQFIFYRLNSLDTISTQIISTFKFTQDGSFSYQLSIPAAWEGNYTLAKTDTSALYTFTGTKSYPLFSLHKVTSSEWVKMQSMPTGGIQHLLSKDSYVYYASTSLDNPLSPPDSQPYQSMSAAIPNILKTFIPN